MTNDFCMNSLLTPPFAVRSYAPVAANRSLQATWPAAQVSMPRFHSLLAAREIFRAPIALQKDKDHRRPTTTS
jgi:hypothetical protein